MARRLVRASVSVRRWLTLIAFCPVIMLSACSQASTAPATPTATVPPTATAGQVAVVTATPRPLPAVTSAPPPAIATVVVPSPTVTSSPTLPAATTTLTPTASPIPATATPSVTPAPSATATPEPTLTPTPTETLSPQAALARDMFMAINAERAKSGLVTPMFTQGTPPAQPQPLAVDDRLAQVAEAHARDMGTRGYFSHTSLEGKTPQDRIREAQIDFIAAIENIYMAQGDDAVSVAMTWFMQDQIHRDAILNPRFNRVGIGIHIEGKMIYFVQKFIEAP